MTARLNSWLHQFGELGTGDMEPDGLRPNIAIRRPGSARTRARLRPSSQRPTCSEPLGILSAPGQRVEVCEVPPTPEADLGVRWRPVHVSTTRFRDGGAVQGVPECAAHMWRRWQALSRGVVRSSGSSSPPPRGRRLRAHVESTPQVHASAARFGRGSNGVSPWVPFGVQFGGRRSVAPGRTVNLPAQLCSFGS